MNYHKKAKQQVMLLICLEYLVRILTINLWKPDWAYQCALRNAREAFTRNQRIKDEQFFARSINERATAKAEAARNTILDKEDS